MGVILIIIGLVVLVAISVFWGIVLIAIGLVLLFIPNDGVYGYHRWHGRRRGPPPY